jgi:hypothetical protein
MKKALRREGSELCSKILKRLLLMSLVSCHVVVIVGVQLSLVGRLILQHPELYICHCCLCHISYECKLLWYSVLPTRPVSVFHSFKLHMCVCVYIYTHTHTHTVKLV